MTLRDKDDHMRLNTGVNKARLAERIFTPPYIFKVDTGTKGVKGAAS